MIYLNGASTKRMEWYNSITKVICEWSFWWSIHATTLLHGWLELARDQGDGVDPVVTTGYFPLCSRSRFPALAI